MAPLPPDQQLDADSFYLPSLEKCLSSGQKLLSWRLIFNTLSHGDEKNAPQTVQRFLDDDTPIALLRRPLEPFQKATPQTKADLESRTAAIHVTPSKDGRYNIDEIKADAAWLASEVQMDEVTALRLTVLEWQDRTQVRIRGETPSKLEGDALQAARRTRLLELVLEEKSHILAVYLLLKCATKLSGAAGLGEKAESGKVSKLTAPSSWMAKIVERIESSNPSLGASELVPLFDGVESRLAALQEGCKWSLASLGSGEKLDFDFRSAQLLDIYRILQLAFVHITQLQVAPSESVKSWFDLVERYFFFSSLSELPQELGTLSSRIQSLASLISLQILSLNNALDLLENVADDVSKLHVLNTDCRKTIDSANYAGVETNNALASLSAFAWSVILLNLLNHPSVADALGNDGFRSPEPVVTDNTPVGLIVDAVSRFQLGRDDALDSAAKLAQAALDTLQVFAVVANLAQNIWSIFEFLPGSVGLYVRILLLDVMRQGAVVANYGPEVVAAVLSLLSPDGNSSALSRQERNMVDHHIASLVGSDDSIFVPYILQTSQTRYPYELQPFLHLWTTLSIQLGHEDERFSGTKLMSSSLTYMLPVSYRDYEIEGSNHIALTRALALVGSDRATVHSRTNQSTALVHANSQISAFQVPNKTHGAILTDGKPMVVQFRYRHLVLEYLVAVLSTGPTSSPQWMVHANPPTTETLTDIINFITANVLSLGKSHSSPEELEAAVEQFLGFASERLDRNADIVSLVQDIFEEALGHQVQQPDTDSLRLLTSCVNFFHALFPSLAGRVWPALIRSGLTKADSGNASIAAIVSASELPAGRYDFFEASVYLFEAAVNDVVGHSMHRRLPRSSAGHRFNDNKAASMATLKGIDTSLLGFTRTCTEFLQSSMEWYFAEETQRKRIILRILATFKHVLVAYFGHDNNAVGASKTASSSRLCAELEPSAHYIMTASSAQLGKSSFLESMKVFLSTDELEITSISTLERSQSIELARLILSILSLMVRVCKLRNASSNGFVDDVRNTFPDLVRLYTFQPMARIEIMQLLLDVMDTSSSEAQDYQSLFGKLGEDKANDFIAILTEFGSPIDDDVLEEKIWTFLTDVVASKHRWFATLLLLGVSPREALKSKDPPQHRSLLTNALDFLQGKEELSSKRCQSRLRFLISTLNHWQWTTSLLQKRSDLLNKLADFTTASYTQDNGVKSVGAMIEAANQFTTLSLIAELLAIYIHNLRQTTNAGKEFVKHLLERISAGSLEHDGVAPPNYNKSLHKNLRQLFEKKFPGWSPMAFKGTLGTSVYGRSYFYDHDYASEVMSFNPAWRKGMSDEFARANCNLSVVQSQVTLAKSWKSLALELSSWAHDGTASHRQLAYIAHKCLYANKQQNDEEPLFNDLTHSRTDLALVILQRLVDAGSTVSPIATLRALILDAISEYAQNDEVPLTGAAALQYRTLLRMLLLALQVRPSASGAKDLSAPSDLKDEKVALVDIVSFVVAKRFRVLASQVYDNASAISPIDFALITNTLHGVLALPSADTISTQIGIQLVQSNVSQYATALFSWSDRISLDENDPIFAEISVMFLLQLSNLQVVTDNFATEGLLSQLSSSNVMNSYRRPHGSGPFEKPLRLFSTWSRGILPLCLNMLTIVGESLGAEVIAFLNSFAPQLERASTALDPKETSSLRNSQPGTLTLSTVHEAHTLAMISCVLERFRSSPAGSAALAEIGDLKWDKAGVKQDVETWLHGSKAALRERIAPVSAREEQLLKEAPLAASDGFESRLEEMVWRELQGALLCLNGANGA